MESYKKFCNNCDNWISNQDIAGICSISKEKTFWNQFRCENHKIMIKVSLSVRKNVFEIHGEEFSQKPVPSKDTDMIVISFNSVEEAINHFVTICNIPLRTNYDHAFFNLSQAILEKLGFWENKEKWINYHNKLK